jgi:hypothetical protein
VTVTAGQRLGMTGTSSFGIDLDVVNDDRTLSFVNPSKHSSESLHADARSCGEMHRVTRRCVVPCCALNPAA